MFGLRPRLILLILIIAAILYAAAQYVPAYVTYVQFNDFIRQEVKYAAASRRTIEDVRRSVVERAEELEIELGPKEPEITQRGPSFTLDVSYQVPIDLRVYKHDLTFDISESGESFENARD